jgi:5'-nucleotidase
MLEWWIAHENLLVESGMNENIIEDIYETSPNTFREGTKEFFKILSEKNVPILIFSAGVGNMIEYFMKKKNILGENVHILSNFFEFDENGKAKGYSGKIIHVMNKSESDLDEKYKQLVSKRKNVILLGDSIDDLGMVNKMETENIIKIGFLNEDVENKLDLYKKNFDVVITGDGSMEFVNGLLGKLLG